MSKFTLFSASFHLHALHWKKTCYNALQIPWLWYQFFYKRIPSHDAWTGVNFSVSPRLCSFRMPVNAAITMLGNAKYNPKSKSSIFLTEVAKSCKISRQKTSFYFNSSTIFSRVNFFWMHLSQYTSKSMIWWHIVWLLLCLFRLLLVEIICKCHFGSYTPNRISQSEKTCFCFVLFMYTNTIATLKLEIQTPK